MPSITPPTELDQLVALIAAHPDGLGIDAIDKLQGNRLTRRTLQRRLALLTQQGRIQMLGEARAVRYVPAPVPTVRVTGEVYVPTSPQGGEIKACESQWAMRKLPDGGSLACNGQSRWVGLFF